MKKTILFYCQHLLGIGHYVRSLALAKGLKNHKVFFVNGGVPIETIPVPSEITFVQLPPIQADEQFQLLLTGDDETFLRGRAQKLQELYAAIQPDIIIIELFPFGRKKFQFELIPLLEANLRNAKRARVVSSLRDILVQKRDQAKFEERVCQLVNRYFDDVLVHADPKIHVLDSSFSRVGDLKANVHYTGYVVTQNGSAGKKADPHKRKSPFRITVSAGGGRVGLPLFETAVRSFPLLAAWRPVEMTLVTGPFLPPEQRHVLDALTEGCPGISTETFVPNLTEVLRHSDVSVSMAGYNTCMDVLQARVRSVLVPFTGGGNDEQWRRARALSEVGLATVLHPRKLAPENLRDAIVAAARSELPGLQVDLAGVERTNRLVSAMA
ncbi:MAG: glycosyl transferase [Calditrichaeota bacterium]|nr:MAG: glycosyl transferase [Calditrichota bacterium]